jgi:hypothetical protein
VERTVAGSSSSSIVTVFFALLIDYIFFICVRAEQLFLMPRSLIWKCVCDVIDVHGYRNGGCGLARNQQKAWHHYGNNHK